MSNRRGFKQHARARVDQAIGAVYSGFFYSRACRRAFDSLLAAARSKSSLLHVTGDGSAQLLAIEALHNMACMHREFREWCSTWVGGQGSVYELVHSLACHLFGQYRAPAGFGLVWFGDSSQEACDERRWFIEHACGRRFRDITNLPMKMTRKMERILLQSPHHLPLRAAMRRAEILALGGEPELVEAVLATPLAGDLRNGEYWRSVMHFFVNHWGELGPGPIPELVDMLHALRIEPREAECVDGRAVEPSPKFSLAGRTPTSLLRLLAVWKRQGVAGVVGGDWPRSGLPTLCCRDEIGEWRMLELLDVAALAREGQAMRHCVSSYRSVCMAGRSRIWSLRLRDDSGHFVSRATVEVRLERRAIVQIRGYRNRTITGRRRALIERWAELAELNIEAYAW